MIEINHTSRELNKVEKYLMTTAPSIKKLSDLADNVAIKVTAFCTFDDVKVKDDGTFSTTKITSVMTEDGGVYASNSMTFNRTLMEIADIMGDEMLPIIKRTGKSKAGRSFIYAELDVSAL